MATVAPAPMDSNSFPTRKPSLRSGLRRGPTRPQLDRAQSIPASNGAASNSPLANAHADSSDDEIPVPMKLSALTKALLDDGDGPEADRGEPISRVRTRAQSHRPSSPVNTAAHEQDKPQKRRSALSLSTSSNGDAQDRRHTRVTSAQPSSRPTSPNRSHISEGNNSPVRKRIVRLATTSGSNGSGVGQVKTAPTARRQASVSGTQKRTTSSGRDAAPEEPGNVSEVKSVNTPVGQQSRVVRIVTSGSANRGQSSFSSGASSRKAETASHPTSENEAPEDGIASQSRGLHGSGSTGSKPRIDENQPVHSSLRVRGVNKVPGSFFKGPARRVRRRQSEEDGEEAEPLSAGQEPESQLPLDIDLGPLERIAASYYAPDRIASGSPVSAKNSARRQREAPEPEVAAGRVSRQTSPDHEEIPIPHYRIPPPKPTLPSRHDQENEAPPTFKRSKAAGGVLADKDIVMLPPAPLKDDIAAPRATSPERKPLAPVVNQPQNTPHRAAPPPPPKMSILDAATSTAGGAQATQLSKKRNYLKVNGKYYTRLEVLGRGGSAKVYRVAADNEAMFALKRVSVEHADEIAMRGFKGEIDLLKKLHGVERVIKLFDYEMNEEKQVLSLLMENGELDFNKLLSSRSSAENPKFDPVFVRFYWQEMLECLAAVHEYDIVHSDLKPANFVLVKGRLKLIDFGIANAIQTDETVNVHRETQIGTPNYMSPESLIDSNTTGPDGRRVHSGARMGAKLMKLGKPSDIWSLGCILFQLVYGTPPFGHISNQLARCHAIIDWQHPINFRERGLGDVPVPPSLLRTLKRCLNRDQHLRPTAQELLSPSDPFLHPVEVPEGHLPISEELLGRIIQSVVSRCRERMPTESEAMSIWPGAYWASVAKAVGRDPR